MDYDEIQASDQEESLEPSSSHSSVLHRACDTCRARKLRCNRQSPCSRCLSAKTECTYTDNRPKEKRTRILLTAQYEKKIDTIDSRLNAVVGLLEDLKTNWPAHSASLPRPASNAARTTPSTAPPTFGPSIAYSPAADKELTNSVAEGNSSLAAHSEFANGFLHNVVSMDALQDTSLEMRETLDALHHIVNTLKHQMVSSEMTYPNARPAERPSLPGRQLPPIEKAVAVMQLAKSKRSTAAIWVYEFLPFARLHEVCLNVYFSNNYSEADFITANAGLYSLFWFFSHSGPESEKEEHLGHANLCRDNLEIALSSLPLHLPATSNVIVALLLGTFYAIEISKPSLSWTLSSKASELCQTLGYHRAAHMKNDEPEDAEYKQFIFWCVYLVDKGLSLRLGRASTIPDWDVAIPSPTAQATWKSPLRPYFCLWVTAARCQGKIYELLYSPSSVGLTDELRQSRVESVARELEDLAEETEATNKRHLHELKEVIGESLADFFALSDEVLRLSLLTLVYRAAPRIAASPTTFSEACISAARETLERHQECMVVLEKSNFMFFPIYVHWTILFSPFVPFIILFCHAMETLDRTDLIRLHTFNVSMRSAPSVSDAAAKTYKLFQVLYSVALRYVEFRTSSTQLHASDRESGEIDACLSALGFPVVGEVDNSIGHIMDGGMDEGSEGSGGVNTMVWMGSGAQLNDWFYSSSQMMGLLQETNFNFPAQE